MPKLQLVDLEPAGPGTPAGRYLRLFWQPVYRARDLAPGKAKPIEMPQARRAALRQAFDRMVADPAFRADAAGKHIELDPTPGARVQEISDAIVSSSPKAVEMVGEAIK